MGGIVVYGIGIERGIVSAPQAQPASLLHANGRNNPYLPLVVKGPKLSAVCLIVLQMPAALPRVRAPPGRFVPGHPNPGNWAHNARALPCADA